MPTDGEFFPPPRSSEVYAGEGTAYTWRDGAWVESPSYSYEFMAIRRLYEGYWSTVKQLYRLHPAYSGLAGPREQTLFFAVQYKTADDGYALQVRGTMGEGRGRTNSDMSRSQVELTPRSGLFSPFNRIRITQHIDHASGSIQETVELMRIGDSGDRPFMKFVEHGTVYLPPHAR